MLLSVSFSFLNNLSHSYVLFNFLYCFVAMSVCTFNYFNPKGEYSNLFINVVFSDNSFSGKTSFPVKKSYLLTFPGDKSGILIVCLSK